MKRKNVRHSLFSFSSYLCFFLGSAFLVTCSILLFCNSFSIPDTPEFRMRAIATFWNLVFLSLLFTLSYGLWQRWRIHRPVQRILRATDQIAAGDFSVRIEPAAHPLGGSNELDVIIENLNAMAQELSGVETLRTDFIASVSHELKTPLAVIQNDAAMLKSTALSEEDRIAYAQQIFDTTRQLSALITNILKLNKLENQQIFIERSTYLLNEQLCGCLLQFEELLEQKHLDLETELPDVTIQADPELLSLVWNNLLSNAIKFTPEGGKITVLLSEQPDTVQVCVRDNGCGMSPETGRHIFEKFYQGDTSHATQGNGLGLALVKRVIDIFGGEISVESTLGKGSAFTVRLPRESQ